MLGARKALGYVDENDGTYVLFFFYDEPCYQA